MFIKEDEDLYPDLDYSPVAERTRRAVAAIERVRDRRGGLGLVYSPHVTAAPHQIVEIVHAVVDAGASGVMFSETYAGGTVRMVREATRNLPNPPAIYGHNAGIGVKTALDLARGDRPARPSRRHRLPPDGARPSRLAVHPPVRRRMARLRGRPHAADRAGINPTMITRAGALDQGNLILNLQDVESRGIARNVLFLAGSAINSIKGKDGRADPRIGLEALAQAIEVHRSGELKDVADGGAPDGSRRPRRAEEPGALREALRQRYPGTIS